MMSGKFRLFTRRLLIYLNIVVVFFFILACLAPYFAPQKWWFIAVLGLAFPFLLLITLLFFIFWLFFKKKFALLSGISLLVGIKSTFVFFAFNYPGSWKAKKNPGTIRIASWNVARFIEMKRNLNQGSRTRLRMMEQIEEQNADILCLQEFFHSMDPTYYPNLDYIRKKFNYPYWFYSHDFDGDKHFTGSIIFSKFPIIDSGLIRYPRPTLPDALMHADIDIGGDTIRVYTTHLQSLQLGKEDYKRIDKIKEVDDSLLVNSRTIFSKIKWGISHRSIQADIIDQVLDDSPYPLLFCGDLNDVPNSYTYFTVKGDLQDAFLKKGFGIGRTFSSLSPTLRIDYIFADEHFRVRQFNRILRRYSDHYMLVSDVEIRK